jgi:hypothetical protein
MVIRKRRILVGGEEIEVEAFETEVVPGSGEEAAIDSLLREEKIEKEIKHALERIARVYDGYRGKPKNVWFYYKIGKILQFVDKKGFDKERQRIWGRIAADLRPDIFSGKERAPKRIARYPQAMYLLGKRDKEEVGKIKWSHWFEILQYPGIREDEHTVKQILEECLSKNLSRQDLRSLLKKVHRHQ